ncbi:hypothetical protein CORMATOL_02126 [Corynebacterium matruchotii ATCC 33806]|uniref:Uncharacterized protein n=1 Tax=Corynebacterium matruchotii ATCC 33806 TaxID=566549 RepID=C0E550_9CORY|nr:hypothetical protein CORMATOL_02126 [Corynebacterium matruchotii ATCC 33806]
MRGHLTEAKNGFRFAFYCGTDYCFVSRSVLFPHEGTQRLWRFTISREFSGVALPHHRRPRQK